MTHMIDLEPYRNQITNLCRLLRVKELELFGSATRDDFSPDSDIDVLVTFKGREQLFARYFDLKEGLEQIFGRHVDVVMPEAITNPIFREHVEKERTVVYGA
jgi:predicted nucleotidyltransferase